MADRKIETSAFELSGVISDGSLFYSDSYHYYVQVARNLNLMHRVVNHSTRFVESDGKHTNNIIVFGLIWMFQLEKHMGQRKTGVICYQWIKFKEMLSWMHQDSAFARY